MKTQTPDPLAAPKLLPIHCPGPRCVGVLMFLQSTCRIRCFFRSRKSGALFLDFSLNAQKHLAGPKFHHRLGCLVSQSVTPRFEFCSNCWICLNCYMDTSNFLHGFAIIDISTYLSCYIDWSKLIHGFLYVVTGIFQN